MTPWKLWNGWGPHTDGLMRVLRIGPDSDRGGLFVADGGDIVGSKKDLEAVCNALNEKEKLLKMLLWCAQQTWEVGDIDGGDFQEAMVKAGLFVEVEADDHTRAEWDTEVMYVVTWSELAK